MSKSKILVVGGTGYIGKRIVKASLAQGHPTYSLVDAVKQVDVVICTMSGVQFRSHNILLQLKLVDAIKEAGNVKLVSYPSISISKPSPKLLEAAKLHAHIACFMDEDDVATYTIKTIDDPRMLNKTLYLRPDENIVTQNQLVEKWESF
ncbi:isoflavone reductase [Tanacetum coccineum]